MSEHIPATNNPPIVVHNNQGAHLLVRIIYFFLFGLWFSGIWAAVAWVLSVTVIGLPFGLWMLNRLPQVATLKPIAQTMVISRTTGEVVARQDLPQLPLLLRVLYFVLIGWWLSAIWISVAWALCASVIGALVGFWMIDRVPAVITLARQS